MAKFAINSLFIYASRRSYAVVSENVRTQMTTTSVMKKVAESSSGSSRVGEEQKVFWMRDPNTGYWIPETHFGQIDVADLREKLLSKKHKL